MGFFAKKGKDTEKKKQAKPLLIGTLLEVVITAHLSGEDDTTT